MKYRNVSYCHYLAWMLEHPWLMTGFQVEYSIKAASMEAAITMLESYDLFNPQSTTGSWAAHTVRNTLPFKSGTKHQSAMKIANNYASRN